MGNRPWMHLVLLSCRVPHCCVLHLANKHLMKTTASKSSKSEMKNRTLYRNAEEEPELLELTCMTSWCHQQWPLCRHPEHDRVILQMWRECAASAAQPWRIRSSTIWTHTNTRWWMTILQTLKKKVIFLKKKVYNLNTRELYNAISTTEDTDQMPNDLHHNHHHHKSKIIMDPHDMLRSSTDLFLHSLSFLVSLFLVSHHKFT